MYWKSWKSQALWHFENCADRHKEREKFVSINTNQKNLYFVYMPQTDMRLGLSYTEGFDFGAGNISCTGKTGCFSSEISDLSLKSSKTCCGSISAITGKPYKVQSKYWLHCKGLLGPKASVTVTDYIAIIKPPMYHFDFIWDCNIQCDILLSKVHLLSNTVYQRSSKKCLYWFSHIIDCVICPLKLYYIKSFNSKGNANTNLYS